MGFGGESNPKWLRSSGARPKPTVGRCCANRTPCGNCLPPARNAWIAVWTCLDSEDRELRGPREPGEVGVGGILSADRARLRMGAAERMGLTVVRWRA